MAHRSKGKKKRVPRPVLLPLGMKRETIMELPLQAAIEALGKDWFGISHLAEILVHAELIKDHAPDPHMGMMGRSIFEACGHVLSRYHRLKVFGVNGDELRVFKEYLPLTVPYARAMPNHVIYKFSMKGIEK